MRLQKILEDLSNRLQGGSDDSEVPMAISDLRAIADMASKLAEHLMQEQPQELEGWVQAKITKAADYIDAVHKNHMYSSDGECESCGDMKEALEPKSAYGDMIFTSTNNVISAAKKLDKPENYSVLSDKEGKRVMLTTNQRAAQFEKEGNWMKIGKIDPNGNFRKQESALFEVASTCCGRCGHKHVKGTSCPKPYLTGARHCRNRK